MQSMTPDNWLYIAAVGVAILLVVGVIVIIANLFSGRASRKRQPDASRDAGADTARRPTPPGAPAPMEAPSRAEPRRRASRSPDPMPEAEVLEESMPDDDIAMSAPAAGADPNFTTVTVHYGTDRNDNGASAAPNVRFGDDRFVALPGA